MDEGTVRQTAQMYALIAEIEEIKAGIEGMKADNLTAHRCGDGLPWPGSVFAEASESLSKISWNLKNEI